MSTRRVIPGVLHNFLGTLTSRYSDFGGYWLFGFLIEVSDSLHFDLLEQVEELADSTPTAVARRLAVQKFEDQLRKGRLPAAWLREARLDIRRSPESRTAVAGDRTRTGYDLEFEARVVTDLGGSYVSTASVFVSPHDSGVELQSSRAKA
ncbi:hypothetical protein [Steroidobacter sp.]|uniref:hypothetical protein n=1 Tax=Steroidobacter sp. TaxID=1978227 RepID=UPI001A477F0A|nr:hypothetical protein [Steroidobacter sp.]MBL8269408.1 hypothetical protein [Steroidobacter sp.]